MSRLYRPSKYVLLITVGSPRGRGQVCGGLLLLKRITVVLPASNEAGSLRRLIEKLCGTAAVRQYAEVFDARTWVFCSLVSLAFATNAFRQSSKDIQSFDEMHGEEEH